MKGLLERRRMRKNESSGDARRGSRKDMRREVPPLHERSEEDIREGLKAERYDPLVADINRDGRNEIVDKVLHEKIDEIIQELRSIELPAIVADLEANKRTEIKGQIRLSETEIRDKIQDEIKKEAYDELNTPKRRELITKKIEKDEKEKEKERIDALDTADALKQGLGFKDPDKIKNAIDSKIEKMRNNGQIAERVDAQLDKLADRVRGMREATKVEEKIEQLTRQRISDLAHERLLAMAPSHPLVQQKVDLVIHEMAMSDIENMVKSKLSRVPALEKKARSDALLERPQTLRKQIAFAIFHPFKDRETYRSSIRRQRAAISRQRELLREFRALDIEDIIGMSMGEKRTQGQRYVAELVKSGHRAAVELQFIGNKAKDVISKEGSQHTATSSAALNREILDDIFDSPFGKRTGGDKAAMPGTKEIGKFTDADKESYLMERNRIQAMQVNIHAIQASESMAARKAEMGFKFSDLVGSLKNGILQREREIIHMEFELMKTIMQHKHFRQQQRTTRLQHFFTSLKGMFNVG